MHDPDVYPEPFEFRPDRFVRDGKLDGNVRNPLAFIFGFGRRFGASQPEYHVWSLTLWPGVGSVREGTLL